MTNGSDDSFREEISNYRDFDDYITKLFEKIYDRNYMSSAKEKHNMMMEQRDSLSMYQLESDRYLNMKNVEDLDKYREKVQEYTQYDIGRKIPESVQCFSEE